MLWGAAAVEGKGAAMFDAELGGRRKININMLPQLRKAILTKNLILCERKIHKREGRGGLLDFINPFFFKYFLSS